MSRTETNRANVVQRRLAVFAVMALLGLQAETWAQTGSALTAAESQQLVNEHNRVRRQAGVAANVSWDSGIAQYAQQWANYLASIDRMQHRSGNRYGENIYWGSRGSGTISNAIQSWESEKRLYNGEAINDANFRQFGHYTQMIWESSTRIGCGKATSSSGRTYIVCNYHQKGNIFGQRPSSGLTPPVTSFAVSAGPVTVQNHAGTLTYHFYVPATAGSAAYRTSSHSLANGRSRTHTVPAGATLWATQANGHQVRNSVPVQLGRTYAALPNASSTRSPSGQTTFSYYVSWQVR